MTRKNAKRFQPDWATHPGEHLAEQIEANGWSPTELARRANLPAKLIHDIIEQQTAVTPETALKLEAVLEPKAEIWLGIQSRWELHHARQLMRETGTPGTQPS
jgi:HTH-type transcriptional regulator / antitoxin HigA